MTEGTISLPFFHPRRTGAYGRVLTSSTEQVAKKLRKKKSKSDQGGRVAAGVPGVESFFERFSGMRTQICLPGRGKWQEIYKKIAEEEGWIFMVDRFSERGLTVVMNQSELLEYFGQVKPGVNGGWISRYPGLSDLCDKANSCLVFRKRGWIVLSGGVILVLVGEGWEEDILGGRVVSVRACKK